MNTRSQGSYALAGLAGLVLLFVGMLLAGYIPALEASLTPEELAAHYRENPFLTRLGILLIIIGCAGWASVIAVVWVQLRRLPDSGGPAAALHLVTGTTTYVFLSLFGVLLAAAAFRPERAPEITQMLHDIGWYMAFLAAVPFVVQALVVGLAVLGDRSSRPVYPRWVGFAGLWVAIALLPGDILLFFKTGPFAYHGIISFWIPLFGFGGWWTVLAVVALRASRAQTAGSPSVSAAA
ncbi:MAG: hypothetical protein ACT4O0_14740 [Pseudonocardia sp.]|jgi:hypothetical protein